MECIVTSGGYTVSVGRRARVQAPGEIASRRILTMVVALPTGWFMGITNIRTLESLNGQVCESVPVHNVSTLL